METRSTECFSRPDTPSSNISDSSESSSSGVQHDKTSSCYRLVRWEEAHVKLLIALWKQFKHLITEGKKSKKDVFTIIAFEFNKKSKEKVTGDQCLRKWGKLVSQHKGVEDHNSKSGNERKDWKFYEDMSECLDKDVSVKPIYTVESSAQKLGLPSSSKDSDDPLDDDEDEPEVSNDQEKKVRCRKRPRGRSSAADMLTFLKEYSEKREKAEEEKLKLAREINEEKKGFFNRFFDYMEKKKRISRHGQIETSPS